MTALKVQSWPHQPLLLLLTLFLVPVIYSSSKYPFPWKTGLVIRFEQCEKDLSSCTLLHFYPCLHSIISNSLSPALLMRCGYPGANESFRCTQSGDGRGWRWISSVAVLTYPSSTQVYLCLPVSHFPLYCRIMSLQDGILRISELRCVDSSCLIPWPCAGGKTEGHGL